MDPVPTALHRGLRSTSYAGLSFFFLPHCFPHANWRLFTGKELSCCCSILSTSLAAGINHIPLGQACVYSDQYRTADVMPRDFQGQVIKGLQFLLVPLESSLLECTNLCSKKSRLQGEATSRQSSWQSQLSTAFGSTAHLFRRVKSSSWKRTFQPSRSLWVQCPAI